MIPSHHTFYDLFSKGERIKIQWPEGARLAVNLTGNLEAWTETPDPKIRRTRHVGGSNPITADEVRTKYDFRTASENDYGGRTGVWRILRILEKHDLKASFNINGLAAVRYPEAVKKIYSEGHEIVGHSYAETCQASVNSPAAMSCANKEWPLRHWISCLASPRISFMVSLFPK